MKTISVDRLFHLNKEIKTTANSIDSYDPTNEKTEKKASFTFFTESVSIRYQDGIFDTDTGIIDDQFITNLISSTNLAKLDETIQDLQEHKRKLNLPDWLFYLMLRDCAEVIYNEENENVQQVLFCWLILGRLDYKVQLNLVEDKAFITVFTLQKVYDLPLKKYGVGWLVEITGSADKKFQESFKASMRANHFMHTGSRIFSFKLDKLPHLPSRQLKDKEVFFKHDNKSYTINYTINETMVRMVDTYPDMKISNYLNFPLSVESYGSLIPTLRDMMEGKTKQEKLRFLLSFTRLAFQYGKDEDHYERINVIFSPEQTLLHDYSDCEDKSVLFSYLVKELIDLEVILLQFDNHLSVAVRLKKYVGKPVIYNKQPYTFCDPTGPSNDLKIGEYPPDLIEATYSVIE